VIDAVLVPLLLALRHVPSSRTFGPAPQRLRELADSRAHTTALNITSSEWEALASLDLHGGLTREGHIALLVLLRATAAHPRAVGRAHRGRGAEGARARPERLWAVLTAAVTP